MCEIRFFICKHCGNLVGMIKNSGVPIICCGEPMSELIPGSVDASYEKHVPVISVSDNIVTVDIGSAAHPMTEESKQKTVASANVFTQEMLRRLHFL